MTFCAEDLWFNRYCPDTRMDGDGDGIPCESSGVSDPAEGDQTAARDSCTLALSSAHSRVRDGFERWGGRMSQGFRNA
jgi:hypothetical protein